MEPSLQQRLKHCPSLPSPPTLATRLLELCESRDVDMDEVSALIRHDPALTARLLRAANSPVYGYRRRATTLKDALLFLGVNGAVSLALTFTLALPLQHATSTSSRYKRLWQRSALSALIATETAQRLGLRDLEQLFLTALLQDIGVFALLQLEPDYYGKLIDEAQHHADLPALEQARFDTTHAALGGWLLSEWRVPEHITIVVQASHQPVAPNAHVAPDVGCIALSWRLAEYLMHPDASDSLREETVETVKGVFSNEASLIPSVLESVQDRVPELNQLFEADVLDTSMRESMLDRARELLLIRNLKMIGQTETLKTRSRHLEARAEALREQAARDSLTGLYGRTTLDETLERNFVRALETGEPLSVLMIDLDHFKHVNDQYGHVAGDNVLRTVATIIRACTRESDFAARYGGDEFVVLLANISASGATTIAERIRTTLGNHTISSPTTGQQPIRVTASIGTATLDANTPHESVWQFIHAADQALYSAKEAGRNSVTNASEETQSHLGA
ncbi:MAG TPA: GGDEF domain-containing protein [Gammaproteobacteria bacterium]|nr:GGDEF domain-containing protein [Gammaproteobacteria bacterium]